MDPATVNISSVILRLSGSSTNLSGVVQVDSVDPDDIIFTPSSGLFATLSPATSACFTFIMLGSGSAVGIKNLEGFFGTTTSASFITSTQAMGPDITPPTVSGTTPVSGSTGFAMSGKVNVKFSESVQSGTVSTSNVKVRVSGAGSDTAATVALNSDLVTAVITPTSFLSGNTVYKGFVHPAIKDIQGNTMAATYSWSFTTYNPPAPTVSGTTPSSGASGVAVTGHTFIVFNTPILSGTIPNAVKIRVSGSTVDTSGTVTVSSNLTTIEIAPTSNLFFCTRYNIFAHNTIKESLGVTPMAASYSAAFSTFCPDAPTVSGTTPSSDATNVSVGTSPIVVFSTQMASSTLTTSSIHVRISGSSTDAAGVVTTSSNLLAVEFSPSTNLAYSTVFNVFLDGSITEVLGARTLASYTWSFTTADPAFTSIYNVSQNSSDDHHLDNNRFRVGFRVKGGSTLIGHTPRKVTFKMRKEGTPLSGLVSITLRGASGDALVTTFGTKNTSSFSTTYTNYTFTNLSANHALEASDKILVEWVSGSSSNKIGITNNTTDPFTGAVCETRDGSSYSGSAYVDQTGEDIAGIVYELS